MKHGKLRFEYAKIDNNIFIGTNMCCQTHFDKELLQKGITADISLEEKRLDQPFGVDYYLWLPTVDHQASSIKQMRTGVAFLETMRKLGARTYVHCQRGHGRAPSLIAAYFVSLGMNAQEAFSLIKKNRPTIHPNKHQIALVKKFETLQRDGK